MPPRLAGTALSAWVPRPRCSSMCGRRGSSRPGTLVPTHSDQWSRDKVLFWGVLALAGADRQAYLAEHCPDEATRYRILALLEAHERAGDFLERPPDVLTREDAGLEREQLGPYRVLECVGMGGMGSVYRALDTRLDRVVALKVLAPVLASSPLFSGRAAQEARAIAALNHPHICTLHDFGHFDGVDVLVMEFLEGETVAARLARGPMTFTAARSCVSQIASALDAIHRAGLVHGDITPANVMLTKTGAKLLDFGLSLGRTSVSYAPAMGTLRYMAPELLAGHPATPLTDIFALGALSYEMFTGRPAFKGTDEAALVLAIREERPPQPDGLPPQITDVMFACLAKAPDERWRAAGDLSIALSWPDRSDAARHAEPTGRWLRAAAIAAVTVSILGLLAAGRESRVIPQPVVRFDVTTAPTSEPTSIALSPDGTRLAFVASADAESMLWIRALDQAEAQPLAGTTDANFPFWAPDGRSLAFFAAGKLKRLDLDAKTPVVLADAPNGRGGAWSSDDTIVFAPNTAGPLLTIPATGGTVRTATVFGGGERSHRWPHFVGTSREFVYLSTQGTTDAPGLYLASLGESRSRRLVDADSSPVVVPPETLLFVRGDALVALTLNTREGVVRGEPVPLERPVALDATTSKAAVSAVGSALAIRARLAERRQFTWVDRLGKVLGTVATPDEDGAAAPELSPDDRSVAFFRSVAGNTDAWLASVESGVVSRHTFNPLADMFPVWSPDAREVAYLSVQPQGYFLESRPAIGNADPSVLLPRSQLAVPTAFSPDGRLLLFTVQEPTTGVDLWAMPVREGEPAYPLLATPYDEMGAQVSPDGRWLAFQSNASGRMEIYVGPVRRLSERRQVSPGGGAQPRWSRDGRTLFYVSAESRMTALAVRPTAVNDSLDIGRPETLFGVRLATGVNVPPAVGSRPQYAVARDGRLLLNSVVDDAAPPIAVSVGRRFVP